MKNLLKFLALARAARHGRFHGHKPWKAKKWKKHRAYGYDPRYSHSPYGHGPYGYGPPPRPRGLKGLILEAILHRLLRR